MLNQKLLVPVLITVALIFTAIVAGSIYDNFVTLYQAKMAVNQLNDDNFEYGFSRMVATTNMKAWMYLALVAVLAYIWVPIAYERFRR